MWRLVRSAGCFVRDLIRSRAHLAAENQFLRQQLAVLRRQVGRARPTDSERRLLAFFGRLFPWRAREALHLVTPGTLIPWHRLGWRLYWTWKSRRKRRHRGGQPRIPEQVRELIRDMVRRNSQGRPWGIKRVLGELKKLRISVSRRSVQKILREVRPRTPGGQPWSTFLRNHLACTWASRLLHGANALLPRAPRLLRHEARHAGGDRLQRDRSPIRCLDRPAAAQRPPRPGSAPVLAP